MLCGSQHGYTNGRSTLTNMLCFDAALADVSSRDHAYDIIAFDFKKAFDKAPHHHVLEALRKLGVCNTALKWFASFLSGRTQQVRVGSSLSTTCDVTSGILQGLRLKSTITRANGLELEQICPSNNTFANLFRCRAVSQWNKLPANIVSAKSINVFKRLLHNYLFNLQYSDSD